MSCSAAPPRTRSPTSHFLFAALRLVSRPAFIFLIIPVAPAFVTSSFHFCRASLRPPGFSLNIGPQLLLYFLSLCSLLFLFLFITPPIFSPLPAQSKFPLPSSALSASHPSSFAGPFILFLHLAASSSSSAGCLRHGDSLAF